MDINRANMNALFTGYNTAFQNAFNAVPVDYQKFSMIVPNAQPIMEYPFITAFAGMREWIGPRQIKNLESKKLTVTEKPFEDTVSVKRRDIVTDRYGVYTPMIQQMGDGAARLPGELAVAAMVANGTWLDGAAFFGTSRTYGSNTISNYATGALTATTFNTAYDTMMAYLSHTNKPLGVVPDLLVVGPKLRSTAWHIVMDEFGYDGTDKVQRQNENKGIVDLLVLPDLVGTYDDYWFLACTKRPVKPVIVQIGEAANLIRKDREEDDNVFDYDSYVYGTRSYQAAALAIPHLIYGAFVA
jgi:phage major head subunit gpT-like protein